MRSLITVAALTSLLAMHVPAAEPIGAVIPPGPRSIEILAIKPDVVLQTTEDDLFHGYPIRDRLKITDPDETWAVLTALNRDLIPHEPSIALFQPTYGLIVVYKKNTYEYVFCYECNQVQRWTNDAESPEPLALKTQPEEKSSKNVLDGRLNDVHR